MGSGGRYSETPCTKCGETGYSLKFYGWEKMVELGLCFTCKFWVDLLSKKSFEGQARRAIIEGAHYVLGNGYGHRDCGMGGRRFDVEFFDGQRVTSYDVWHQGKIPERFRDLAPDNARFLGGAERAERNGETYAFDPSSNATEPYPLPNGSKGPPWTPAPIVWAPIIATFAKEFAS